MIFILSLIGLKTVGKGENGGYLLVTSIFSFSHIVFKRIFVQVHLKSGLYGKELMAKSEPLYNTISNCNDPEEEVIFENTDGNGEHNQ